MQSTVKVKTLDRIDEDTGFTDLFSNALLYYKQRVKHHRDFTHARLVPHAIDFFKERTVDTTSPVRVLEKALQSNSPFVPGSSIVSTPWEDFFGMHYLDEPKEERGVLLPLNQIDEPIKFLGQRGLHELKGSYNLLHRLSWNNTMTIENE